SMPTVMLMKILFLLRLNLSQQ
ncbi:chlamydia polymorphic membrane middle domain protein, partial [Chlamydia psittaci 02DC18]